MVIKLEVQKYTAEFLRRSQAVAVRGYKMPSWFS